MPIENYAALGVGLIIIILGAICIGMQMKLDKERLARNKANSE